MSKIEKRICASVSCGKKFVPRTANQKYCDSDCQRVQTNKNVLARYHENKNRKSKKGERCKTPSCITLLSSYNHDDYCELCKRKEFEKKLKEFGWTFQEYEDFVL